jgi:hypothetical protein
MDALTPNEAKMLYEQQGAEISIPSNFATIESYAFSELPITKVNIPETINYIGDEAFRSTKLTTIDIPDSVTDIGESVFLWSNLSTISVGKTIEQSFLDQGGDPKRSFLYGSYPTDVIIKDGTTIIGNGAFGNYPGMDDFNIHIPPSVETIGSIAFRDSGITSISLPGVKLIADKAFLNSAITNVNFGDELTEISDDAFANTEISEINFPETLKSIGSRSFANTKLKTIDLKNVESIGMSAFDTQTLEKAFISPKLERYIDATQTPGPFLDSVIINNRSINQSEEDIGNRINEYGSRVPKNFGHSGYIGVADLFGTDRTSRLEFYEGFWYYPKENDANISLNGGSGKDVFLSYSDQALYTDDIIDNYFEVLDFNSAEDLLVLPFLTGDDVKITQENNFIIAEIDTGAKDKIFKLSQRATEKNIGFADQFDSKNIRFDGIFKFNTSTKDSKDSSKKSVSKPLKYKRRFIDKNTNFNSSIDTLEIDTDSFGLDSSATFAAGKNKKTVKKKLAKLDIDFLYDEKKGGLYFNENGADKGFGDGGIIAILKGAPELTSGNLEFI